MRCRMSPASFGTFPFAGGASATCRRGVDCGVGVGTPASSLLSGLEHGEACVGIAVCKRLGNPRPLAHGLSSGSRPACPLLYSPPFYASEETELLGLKSAVMAG